MSRLTIGMFIALTALLIAQPHIITGHIVAIPNEYAQSLATVIILALAACVAWAHRREVARIAHARELAAQALALSMRDLMEAYRHIGTVNRQLALVPNVTTDLLADVPVHQKGRHAILTELLTIAVTSIARVPWGVLRYIDVESGRTVGECTVRRSAVRGRMTVGNHALLEMPCERSTAVTFRDVSVMVTTDRGAHVRCFLILARIDHVLDTALLQIIVDQAQLLFPYLHVADAPRDGVRLRTVLGIGSAS